MDRQLLCTIINSNLPKDYSLANQKKVLKIVLLILDINQKVIKKGISMFEDYCSQYSVLDKGLQLIRMGLEPSIIETLLLNTVIVNNIDLLTSLVIIEGVHDIQTAQSPYVTKELLKSYFTLEFDAEFEDECVKSNLKINNSQVISAKEVAQLIDSIKNG